MQGYSKLSPTHDDFQANGNFNAQVVSDLCRSAFENNNNNNNESLKEL